MKLAIAILFVCAFVNFAGLFIVMGGVSKATPMIIESYDSGLKQYLEQNYVHK